MCQSVGFGWGARRGPVSPLPLPPLAPQRAPPSSAPLPTPTYAKTAPPAAACTYLPPLGQKGKVCPWVYPWKRNAAQALKRCEKAAILSFWSGLTSTLDPPKGANFPIWAAMTWALCDAFSSRLRKRHKA